MKNQDRMISQITLTIIGATTFAFLLAVPPHALGEEVRQLRASKVHRLSKPKGWEIEIAYPQFTGEPAPSIQKLNQSVKNLVDAERKKLQNKGPRIDPLEIPYWFRCDYHALLVNPKIVSLVFHFNQFYGGAHGDNWSVPLNFQVVPEAKPISLEDFFGKKVDPTILSNLCRLELYKKLGSGDSSVVIDGTDFSQAKSSPHFAFDKNGVVFYFDPYAVASYSEGPQEIRFSYAKLHALFAPSSPVYQYVQVSTVKAPALELDSAKLAKEAAAAAKQFNK